MWGYIIAFTVGTWVGLLMMALCIAGKDKE